MAHQNAKNRIKQAKRHAAKAEAKIQRLVAAGRWRKAKRRQRIDLGSSCARITKVSKANAKMPKHRRLNREGVLAVAANLNSWHGTREPVKVIAARKPSGGHRPIMSFGLRNRALQYLAKAAIEPFAELHPGQYALRGTERAVRDLLDAMNDHPYVTVTDIRNAFGSFDADAVVQLVPLPRVVAERTLISCNLNLVFKHNDLNGGEGGKSAGKIAPEELNSFEQSPASGVRNTLAVQGVDAGNEGQGSLSSPYCCSGAHGQFLTSVRLGIPQGSAVSTLVCEMLLAPVLRALPAETRVVSYADDIAMPARTPDEARRNDLSLVRALRRSPAGPLTEKYCKTVATEHGFAYLGYWFDKKHGAPRARPTRENLREFESKLERHYCRIVDGLVMNGRVWPPDLRKIDALLNCIRGWANGFSCWPYARKWAERRLRHYLFLPPGDLRTRVIEHFGGIATPSSRAA